MPQKRRETFGCYERARQGTMLVREICEYHSRGEEYGVILERHL